MPLGQPAASSSAAQPPVAWQWSLLDDLPLGVRATADSELHQETGEAGVLAQRQQQLRAAAQLRLLLWSVVSSGRKRLYRGARSNSWRGANDRPRAWHEEEPL